MARTKSALPVSAGIQSASGTGELADEFLPRVIVLRRTPRDSEDLEDDKLRRKPEAIEEDLLILRGWTVRGEAACVVV